MDRVICPNCKAEVLPDVDGRCPNCHFVIGEENAAPITQKAESLEAPKPAETFGYPKFWRVFALIRAVVWVAFGLLMLWVGFGFVFPSGGVVRFGGLGWLLFLAAPVGLVVGIAQYQKIASYSVELTESAIRIGKRRVKWTQIVKMETHMAPNDMATGEDDAIRLTTTDGSILSIPALTEQRFLIKKYIEDHTSLHGADRSSAKPNAE